VRILFCDLHLLPGGNVRTQHAAIESLLRSNIDPAKSGPYLLARSMHQENKGSRA